MRERNNRRNKRGILVVLSILAMLGLIGCKQEEKPEVEVYVNATDYYQITEEECITLAGEPTNIEEWTYTRSDGELPCKSYYYDKFELVFVRTADGTYKSARMKIYDKQIPFDEETVLQQFGFEKTRYAENNGMSYRCEAQSDELEYAVDFWISSYRNGVIEMLDITYANNVF